MDRHIDHHFWPRPDGFAGTGLIFQINPRFSVSPDSDHFACSHGFPTGFRPDKSFFRRRITSLLITFHYVNHSLDCGTSDAAFRR
jgi:hypothetical protein